jgi:hypothetical protein
MLFRAEHHNRAHEGGSFNRIIGITLLKPGAKLPWYSMAKLRSMLSACMRGKTAHALTSKQLVLRIPGDDVHDLYYQAAALSYLELKLPYSVPKSISFDSSANNALGRAYMLQNRISGHSLSHIWPKLTHEQRKSVARCISEVVRDLHKVKNTCAGVISPRNTIHDLETDLIKIEPVSMPGSTASANAQDVYTAVLALPQTTRDFLLSLISRQRISAEEADIPTFNVIWSSFTTIINFLHTQGLLPDTDAFYLHHPDFYARNLLFTTPNPSTVRFSGIIDWDNTLFAPKFLSTRAPFFLWTNDDADEEEEGDALIEPNDPELRAYKRIFEDVGGDRFCQDAYRPE